MDEYRPRRWIRRAVTFVQIALLLGVLATADGLATDTLYAVAALLAVLTLVLICGQCEKGERE